MLDLKKHGASGRLFRQIYLVLNLIVRKPMRGRIFLDSNICLYILDKNSSKFSTSKQLLQVRPHISTQVVTENINVCMKKFKLSRHESIQHAV
jgi:hypothetical protein